MTARMVSLRKRFAELVPELAKFGVVGADRVGHRPGRRGLPARRGRRRAHGRQGLSITAATVVTYLGSRFWTFRHRVNQALLREGTLFVALNVVGLAIAEIVIAVTTYGLDMKSALAYNAASVIGTGLGTIFRYFSYKKWVFLAGVRSCRGRRGSRAIRVVDAADTSEAGARSGPEATDGAADHRGQPHEPSRRQGHEPPGDSGAVVRAQVRPRRWRPVEPGRRPEPPAR